MKLLLSVIAASVSAEGHGNHDGTGSHTGMAENDTNGHNGMTGHDGMGTKPTGSYTKPTKPTEAPHYDQSTHYDHYDMQNSTDHYNMATDSWHHDMDHEMDHGSGDYDHTDDHYDDHYAEEATSSHHESNCDGPNCKTGCADAMANWRAEMKKWKYMQHEWAKEFKAWKNENGQHDWDMDKDDYGHHDKEDHYGDGHHGQGHHGDADHYNDNYDNDDNSWGWFDDALEMLGPFLTDSDQFCPILGLIGEGWEDGCRRSMEAQNNFMTVIAQVEMMNSKQFAGEFCDSFGNLISVQLDNFMGDDMGMAVQAAQPSCECLAHNIHKLLTDGFQPAMIANIGTCANTVTNFVNMMMNMDDHMPKMDDWYTEEAFAQATQDVNGLFKLLNLEINDDLFTLLRYWDASGEWAKWGLFEDKKPDDELVVKALASAWIYIQNTEPEFTGQQFGAILENAGDWNGFYASILNLANEVIPKQYPNDDAEEKIRDMWPQIMQMMENFVSFLGDTVIGNPDDFDAQAFAEKLVEMSISQGATVEEFVGVYQSIMANPDDISNVTTLVNWYFNHYVENNPVPQKPHYTFGLAKCLNLDDIKSWNEPSAESMTLGDEAIAASIYNKWVDGIGGKYLNDADFRDCIAPFDDFSFDYSQLQN